MKRLHAVRSRAGRLFLVFGLVSFASFALAGPAEIADGIEGQAAPEPVTNPAPTATDQSAAQAATEASIQARNEGAELIVPAPLALDNLAQVLRKVWTDNPQVLQSLLTLEGTGYDISTARTGYFPYIGISSAYTQNDDSSNSTLVAVLPLWSGGATNADVDQAKARQQAALADVSRTRLQVGKRTVEAYLNVAQAQEHAIQWANHLAALKKLLVSIERRAELGVATASDVQIANVRYSQSLAGSESNRAFLLAARAQLASLVHATPPSVDWPDENYLLSEEEIEAAEQRFDQNPEYIRARHEVTLQEAVARRASASLWPEISLQHRRQLDGLTFDPTNDDATLLVMSYQTSSGLRGFRGMQAEDQRAEAARSRVESVTRELQAVLHVDRTQLRALAIQLAAQERASQASNTLVDSFARQYEVGRKSWLEVLNALREAHETQLQFIASKRNYWVANATLALDAMYWHRLGADSATAGEPVAETVTE